MADEKRTVSIERYLGILNERLRRDEDYQDGMEFKPHPEDATGRLVRGISLTTPSWDRYWVLVRVHNEVSSEYVPEV